MIYVYFNIKEIRSRKKYIFTYYPEPDDLLHGESIKSKKTIDEMSFVLPKTRNRLERISNNCDLEDCIFQIRSSGIRAYSLDEPFPTFAVSNSGGGAMIPVLSKERRHLSLTEMRRIMGFPEWYNLSAVSRTSAIKQLANAVCPPVIESICNDIERVI